MRFAGCAALVLILAAAMSGPASAAEPGMAEAPLTRTEAIRIAIQAQLAAKFTEQHPLWVD